MMFATFCGHSEIHHPESFSVWLDAILPSLIEGGAAAFHLGGYGAFDNLAAAAVRRQKAARWSGRPLLYERISD